MSNFRSSIAAAWISEQSRRSKYLHIVVRLLQRFSPGARSAGAAIMIRSRSVLPLAIWVLVCIGLTSCTQSSQLKKERHLAAGKAFFESKDYARAILEFKNAVDLAPRDSEALYQLGRAYLASGAVALGASHLVRATEVNPNHSSAQLLVSELMASTRNPDLLKEAHKRLESISISAPGNVDVLTALAFTEWNMARRDEAERHLREVFRNHPERTDASVGLARMKFENGDFDAAEQILKTAAQTASSGNIWVALAEFYFARSRDQEGAAALSRALEIDGSNTAALLDLAALHLRSGNTAAAEQAYQRTSGSKEPQYKPLHALFVFQSGDRARATAELEQMLRRDPGNRFIRNALFAVYVRSQRLGDAERLISAAARNTSGDAEVLLLRSGIYLALQRFDEAERDLNQVLHTRPDSAECQYLLARLNAERGNLVLQQQHLNEALRINPGLLAARVDLAALFIRTNRPSTAVQTLEEAPAEQRILLPVVLQRNWALLAMGRVQEVSAALDALVARTRTPDVIALAAAVRIQQNRFAAARELAEELLADRSDDLRGFQLLSRAYAGEKRTTEAVQAITQAAGRASHAAPVQRFVGEFLLSHGQREQARAAFERARTLGGGSIDYELPLIHLDIAEGRLTAARDALSGVLAKHGDNVTAHLWLGHVLDLLGEKAAAIEQYRLVVAADSSNVSALNDLAYLLADVAHTPDEALPFAQRAAELAHDNGAVEDTLGWVFYKKGLHKLALYHLERAVKLEPTPARTLHLAEAYLSVGNRAQARNLLASLARDRSAALDTAAAQHLLKQIN
jgi:tetratricopeptide (TPR) repeat protein